MDSSKLDRAVEVDQLRWGRLEDWIQLVRLPNVFTLLSNCVVAAIVSVGSLSKLNTILPLFFASILAYWAGLILNDVNDVEEDQKHRPDRPIASGRISPALANHVATGMLLLGLVIVALVLVNARGRLLWLVDSLVCYCLLWFCIRLYNSSLKLTAIGPLLMGACRSLNILMLGFSLLSVYAVLDTSTIREFPETFVAYAVAVGVYIAGVTTYARREEQASDQGTLVFGAVLELAGLILVCCLPLWNVGRPIEWLWPKNTTYCVLVGLIGVTILNRAISGVMHPVPRKVQLAVKHAILSIIMIDAAIAAMFQGYEYGVGVVALLLPAVLSAFRVRTT